MGFWSTVSDPVVMFTDRVESETSSAVCFLHHDGQGMLRPPTSTFTLKLRGLYAHGLAVPDHVHAHLPVSLGYFSLDAQGRDLKLSTYIQFHLRILM